MYKRILLCSDGSEHAIKAAHEAAELCRSTGANLTMLHVFEMSPMAIPVETGFAVDPSWYTPPAKEVQDEIVQRTASVLTEERVGFADRRSSAFSAAEVIAEMAEKESFDLIIMGRRGIGTFQSLLLGSVSDAVIRHAPCSVLIVK